MSIASRITEINSHLLDDYSVLSVAGADLTNVDKNIVNLKETWQERLLYFMNNGTDIVWNNWNKATGSGTEISLNNTLEAKMGIKLKGNTSQEGTPTPDSPKDIHVVSGDNSITITNEDNTQSQTYPINLGAMELCKIGDYQDYIGKSTGKNLLDRSSCEENKAFAWATGLAINETGSLTSDYIPTTKGKQYRSTYSAQVLFYDNTKTYLGALQQDGTTIEKTTGGAFALFTTPNVDEIAYMRLGYRASYDSSADKINSNIMLNYGNTLLPYEPYGTGWYKYGAIGKVVFNGSENNWDISGTVNFYRYRYLSNFVYEGNIPQFMLCNQFKSSNVGSTNSNLGFFVTSTGEARFREQTMKTIDNWKTWLASNNLIFYYVLATPTYTPITVTLETQLNALELARSYNEQTNLSQTNNDLPFILDAMALEEW